MKRAIAILIVSLLVIVAVGQAIEPTSQAAPVLGTWGANSCGHLPWRVDAEALSFVVHPLHGRTLTTWPAEWPPGDFTGDGRVNSWDTHIMQMCIGGPGLPLPVDLVYYGQFFDRPTATMYSGAWVIPCHLFDFDCDGDVDMTDFGIQQRELGGTDRRYDLNGDGVVDGRDVDAFERKMR